MPVSVISINVQSVHLNNVTFVINTQFWNTVPLFANYTTCDMQPIEPLPPHNSDTEAKTDFCRTVYFIRKRNLWPSPELAGLAI